MPRQTVLSVLSQKAKKKRGPPATGKGTLVGVRLQPAEMALLDDWIAEQEIPPSRPEAMRYHLKRSLSAGAPPAPKRGRKDKSA